MFNTFLSIYDKNETSMKKSNYLLINAKFLSRYLGESIIFLKITVTFKVTNKLFYLYLQHCTRTTWAKGKIVYDQTRRQNDLFLNENSKIILKEQNISATPNCTNVHTI